MSDLYAKTVELVEAVPEADKEGYTLVTWARRLEALTIAQAAFIEMIMAFRVGRFIAVGIGVKDQQIMEVYHELKRKQAEPING